MATYIVPCSADKLPHAAAARDLYVGQMFKHALRTADKLAREDSDARILILSAKHGLVDPLERIEPYNVHMTDAASVDVQTIAAQALAFGIDWDSDVYALLPRAYLERLDDALRTFDCYALDVYEATSGIGEQRAVCTTIQRH